MLPASVWPNLFVPMKLPWILFPEAAAPVMETPKPPISLPEITLRAAGVVPPIVIFEALSHAYPIAQIRLMESGRRVQANPVTGNDGSSWRNW